jgi:predicted DNA-binding protein (MmcQ/YjbR family)
MENDFHRAVCDACLWLPEAEEFVSNGAPAFRVRGKVFAYYFVNHHGDGRVALWLNADPEAQRAWVSADPKHFFVPPYMGSRGWLGVQLNCGLPWRRIATLVHEAYQRTAPSALGNLAGKPPTIVAPRKNLTAADIDPLRTVRGRAVLKLMRAVCLELPEAREVLQFGFPVWQAGKRTFAWLRCDARRFNACFWVGVEQQQLLTADERYRIPAYLGHNGWIALDLTQGSDAAEVAALAMASFRHFALKRMLEALP